MIMHSIEIGVLFFRNGHTFTVYHLFICDFLVSAHVCETIIRGCVGRDINCGGGFPIGVYWKCKHMPFTNRVGYQIPAHCHEDTAKRVQRKLNGLIKNVCEAW